MSAIAPLEKIVGADGVRAWPDLEPGLRSQIEAAVVPGATVEGVVSPSTEAELADVMACASQNQWRVLPLGNGSKLRWGGLATGIQIGVSTARLNRVVEHAVGDLTVTVEAGARFADVQAQLMQVGQFLAIDPAFAATATLGGIVATADTGALRQRYGGIRDMLIGLTLVRSDGQVAKAGGRVVKNVAGYDLMKLFTGSYGTLGLISQLTFRLYPLPEMGQTVVLVGNAEAIAQASQSLLSSGLSPTAIELLSPQTVASLGIAPKIGPGVASGVGLMVRFQSLAVSVELQAEQLLQLGQTLDLKGIIFSAADEGNLWQQLREQMDGAIAPDPITCKIGVLPSQAVQILMQIEQRVHDLKVGVIHAGSGLGLLRFDSKMASSATGISSLTAARQICQASGGFLTLLEAPIAVKQQVDVWGEVGSALPLMQKLKQQFDPQNLLSPHRFVGGI